MPQSLRKAQATTADGLAGINDDDRKSAQTRRRILDAAAHVLGASGYRSLRMKDVAAQAELQAPAIYYYFPSRDDLIQEVMRFGLADLHDQVTATLKALPSDASDVDRVLAAAESHLRHALDLSDYTKACIRNTGQIPAEMRARQRTVELQYSDVWRRLINELARSGDLRSSLHPHMAQMLVLGALNWSVEWWDGRQGSVDSVVATALSIIHHGLIDPAKH